jgi:uncharacterized glyoxalase superfamily metalloenzyme YdcJ
MNARKSFEMDQSSFISPDALRARFSRAMSRMYREEVPAYGALIELVEAVNRRHLERHPALKAQLDEADALSRITEERHGAIRLGTAEELSLMRRLFAVMGMLPVGYYDLSVAGIPVHSTAFRPTTESALKASPFRIFTSLLRLDLISDDALRGEAERVLASRDIFTKRMRHLIDTAEANGGLDDSEADEFISEALETFRWHDRATVPNALYERLHNTHRLLADVVCFKGPHINHLTPRTLDIDEVQRLMPAQGIAPKEIIEGPPTRQCPILLRQTSFKALEERISFRSEDGSWREGKHTARFGEIEQRGIALTRKGRSLYDELLAEASRRSHGLTTDQACEVAREIFTAFPDDYETLRVEKLAYFEYALTEAARQNLDGLPCDEGLETLIDQGMVRCHPIVYEDFLPVSAAGIFQSNLGEGAASEFAANPSQTAFEKALEANVADPFVLYAAMQQASVDRCLAEIRDATMAA